MFSSAKKLHLIEEILKIDDDSILEKIENTLSIAKKPGKKSFTRFAGALSEEELIQMEKAINEGCGQVSKDDWE